MECPISEDVESENQNDYLSDYSSSSTFSLHKKRMSFELSKLIDKLEPHLDDSTSLQRKMVYFNSVNETIEEEVDEENKANENQLQSSESFSKLKASHDKVNFLFFNIKKKKIKSICLESEPILEELEEYQNQDFMDPRNHTFIIPKRDRNDSMELSQHYLNTPPAERKHSQEGSIGGT